MKIKLLNYLIIRILIIDIWFGRNMLSFQEEKIAHFEMNSVDKINMGLKNTIFIDNISKRSFSLTNNDFEPGPKIYLNKNILDNHDEIKRIFKLIRKMLLKFYIEDFGIILTYHLSQIEEIKSVGIDLNGDFKIIDMLSRKDKKKMPKLDNKWLKKDKFPKTNTIESKGLINKNLDLMNNSVEDNNLVFDNYKIDSFSFLNFKNEKFGLLNRNIRKLHLISSKVNDQIAICSCKVNIKMHLKLIQVVQTLLFAIYNTIDSRNSPWYSMPDFIFVLLKDIMKISSIMRFLGPLFGKFKNMKEYYKRAKKQSKRKDKKYYLNFFNNRRNNYQTKFLLQILGIVLSFIGNIFNSFIFDFRRNPINVNLATQIEIDNIQNFQIPNTNKKLFSRQDSLLISEYIDRLPNKKNCIIYQKIDNMSINSPDQAVFSLC